MIEEFIRQFTKKKFKIIKKEHEYFLKDQFLFEKQKQINAKPSRVGLFLGSEHGEVFLPSFPLLELISKYSTKKQVLSEKQEWLFLCKRDIFIKKEEAYQDQDIFLIQNQHDENLGVGKVDKKKNLIRNIIDRGDFLRRERNNDS